jgi:thiamine-phosphate pyrophosphorylase
MLSSVALRGLYAITDGNADDLVARTAAAIAGGARIIQYRDKSSDPQRRATEAAALLTVCHAAQVPLIINDDIELAVTVGADGVHLGRDDADLGSARERMGGLAIIGISCYDDLAAAQAAETAGADYVAFGRFFPSRSKPNASGAPLSILSQARHMLQLPVVAIGGITPDNGDALVQAGADMLAAIEGVFGATDITEAARAYARLF